MKIKIMPDLYREPVDDKSTAEASSAPAPLGFAKGELSSAETEILELEKQLAQKRALLGAEKQKPLEQVIGAEKPAPSSVAPSLAPSSASVAAAPAPKPETQNLKGLEKNAQLKNLVDLAFQKGISYATDVARDLDNPYLMDAFHDTLVDKLHKELVERGKLEEI